MAFSRIILLMSNLKILEWLCGFFKITLTDY